MERYTVMLIVAAVRNTIKKCLQKSRGWGQERKETGSGPLSAGSHPVASELPHLNSTVLAACPPPRR